MRASRGQEVLRAASAGHYDFVHCIFPLQESKIKVLKSLGYELFDSPNAAF